MDEKSILESKKLDVVPTQVNGEMRPIGELILDFASVVAKRRRILIWFVLGLTVLAGGIAAVSPKWYKSTATVFPAQQSSIFSGMEGISSLARTLGMGSALAGFGSRAELDRYIAILKSETALMKVIDRFDLTRVYNITQYPREKTMKELLSNTNFEIAEEGNLVIDVYDKDPRRAADMANYFVQVLNEINSSMEASNARANREFIERRVETNRLDLHNAEDALKKYQEETGMIITPDEKNSGISAVAELYAMKAKKEIELGVLGRSVAKESPLFRQAEMELQEIDKKVALIPATGIGSLRLYRDVLIQQKILEFLIPLYEQAKVEEKRSTPSVMVLDRAEVPERKAKPKILLYVLLTFVVSTILSLFFIFLLEGVQRIRLLQPDRFDQLVSTLRSDWFGLRWKRRSE